MILQNSLTKSILAGNLISCLGTLHNCVYHYSCEEMSWYESCENVIFRCDCGSGWKHSVLVAGLQSLWELPSRDGSRASPQFFSELFYIQTRLIRAGFTARLKFKLNIVITQFKTKKNGLTISTNGFRPSTFLFFYN